MNPIRTLPEKETRMHLKKKLLTLQKWLITRLIMQI